MDALPFPPPWSGLHASRRSQARVRLRHEGARREPCSPAAPSIEIRQSRTEHGGLRPSAVIMRTPTQRHRA